MLNLPVYLLGKTYYFHSRIGGKQVKKSLYTGDKVLAMVRAIELLKAIGMTYKKFEIDIGKGIYKSDGAEDHQRMMETLAIINKGSVKEEQPETHKKVSFSSTKQGLRLGVLLDKFFSLKTHLKQATVLSYKSTIEEFDEFLKKPLVENIRISDVSRYQEFLASKKNTTRTIDSKVGTIRALFNFAIKQGYYFEKNPAENRNLQSKRERMKTGYGIFDLEEIKIIYSSELFKTYKIEDPNYYWVLILALITGCRISEITSLKSSQFKVYDEETNFIRIEDSKTLAGIRDIPIPKILFSNGLTEFVKGKDQIFKYKLRLGKGSGNAVGKKFKRHLEELKITRDKLVFHSIRKFFNNYLMKNENIPIEPRCQLLGHELENVNVQLYSKEYSIDELSKIVGPAQVIPPINQRPQK
jgi:integrase